MMDLSTSSKTRMKVGSKATSSQLKRMHHQLIERPSHQTFDKNKKLSILTESKIMNNLAFMSLEGTFLAQKILL